MNLTQIGEELTRITDKYKNSILSEQSMLMINSEIMAFVDELKSKNILKYDHPIDISVERIGNDSIWINTNDIIEAYNCKYHSNYKAIKCPHRGK